MHCNLALFSLIGKCLVCSTFDIDIMILGLARNFCGGPEAPTRAQSEWNPKSRYTNRGSSSAVQRSGEKSHRTSKERKGKSIHHYTLQP